jgi:two-component system chemotaxis response regulator CheB
MPTPLRLFIVDDSAFLRVALTRRLEADPTLKVVGTARDGDEALATIPVVQPDVVILDVEMPGLDGLATLKRLMAERPTPVVMLSAATQAGTRTSIQALMRGAVEVVAKPTGNMPLSAVIPELARKLKAAALAHPPITFPQPVSRPASPRRGPVTFEPADTLIVIGASTGGPYALQQVLSGLPADLPAAIVVVQHMPAGFTTSLARRLHEDTALTVQEAADGGRLGRGQVLVAPGDYHLRCQRGGRVRLDQEARRNYVRPSIDIVMESAAECYGRRVIGAILTGMGADGTAGARHIKAAGGRVLAEHECTSVVYGMPRSVIEAGLADLVVPLPEVSLVLKEWVADGSPRV